MNPSASRALASATVIAAGLMLIACQPRSVSDRPVFEGDAGSGRLIAQKTCAACHGVDGASVSSIIPRLAGQYPEYLEKQILAFKAGPDGRPKRLSPIMGPIAAGLSKADAANAAAYYASLTPNPATARDSRRLPLGHKVYTEGDPDHDLPACVSCHRPTGAGLEPDFPRIGGQSADYIEGQLAHWEETRGHRGKLMSMIVPHLKPDERQAVADYIAQLRPADLKGSRADP